MNPPTVPGALTDWLRQRGSSQIVEDSARIPGGHGTRPFLLSTVQLSRLDFTDHGYNPRTPDERKVVQLASSIRHLTLLSPLTCYYQPPAAGALESVVLVDGRHRFDALRLLAEEDPRWEREARVDLKVYWNLAPSDVHILATYVNRARQNLKRGEYYQAVVKVYDKKAQELAAEKGRLATEEEIFAAVNARELPDRTFALSIGRLVAIAGFQTPEWVPLVGQFQNQRIPGSVTNERCPITAGNLATLLSYLCSPKPYTDTGRRRGVELRNVRRLGALLRRHLLRPVGARREATATTVGCKHWCLAALGSLIRESPRFADAAAPAPLADPSPNWGLFERLIRAYASIMEEQAAIINRYRRTGKITTLKKAWSYQTQRDQVRGPLRAALLAQGVRI